MLIYSRAAAIKIMDDFKKFTFFYNIAVQSLYIVFLVYALAVSAGNVIANVILATLSAAYLVFYIVIHEKTNTPSKKTARLIKHTYNISKLAVKAFTLVITLYGIHIALSHVSTVCVIFAALSVIGWTLGVLFELVKFVFEKYFDLMWTAVQTDVQPYVNVYNKLTRQETEPKSEKTKTEIYLDALAGEYKKELDEKKAIQKARQAELKALRRKAQIDKVKNLFKIKRNKANTTASPISQNAPENQKETVKK